MLELIQQEVILDLNFINQMAQLLTMLVVVVYLVIKVLLVEQLMQDIGLMQMLQ